MKPVNPINILLVEDNPGDVRLTEEALKEGTTPYSLSVAKDGAEALDFLFKRNGYQNAITPDLILLDLNLPKKDGREVLSEVKQSDSLKHVPVIVLTTSEAEQDIQQSYKLHANCYITKPVDVNEFIDSIQVLEAFWFKIVKLPSYHDKL